MLARARERDEAAWYELVRRFHPILLRYLYCRGVRSPEDLAAEVWLRVHQGLAGLEGDEDEDEFRGWLITVAHHQFVDQHRRARVRPEEVPLQSVDLPVSEDPASIAVARQILLEAIGSLGAPQDEIIRLKLLGGLSHSEIAAHLNMTPVAVRKAYSRAFEQLRRLF